MIGREGMTGLPIVLGNHRSPHATYIQAPGMGKCIPARELRQAIQASVSLRDSLLKFVQAFGVQTTHTAICNAQSKIDGDLPAGSSWRRTECRATLCRSRTNFYRSCSASADRG